MAEPANTIDAIGAALTQAHVSRARRLLRRDGYVYLRGISDGFCHTAELARFGEAVGQYQGRIVREVRPDPKMEAAAISANNMKALSPHTESFEFAGRPPRYVALWCVRPAEGPGGETTLADARRFLRGFSEADIEVMHHRVYEWRSPASLKLQGITMSARHPILEHTPDGLLIRYSSREMRPVGEERDGLHARYVQGGIKFFGDTAMAVRIERNAMLLWDNWRIMHSRNAFADPRRHLRRILLNPRPANG